MTTHIQWDGNLSQEGLEIVKSEGGCIVCPTKVGYIIMTSDKAGLERKFAAKNRKRNKPGVVLCGSMDELRALAQLTPEIESFYQKHWDQDILLGCILPWKEDAYAKLQAFGDGREELMTDSRKTSCFVIKFGVAGEQIAKEMWEKEGKMVYASSANPSGKGNRGKVEGIGSQIEEAVDLVIEADDYVASIQPDKNVETRYEQGVMVSMVDKDGKLIPEQGKDSRSIDNCPVVIRKGLDIDKIMMNLSDTFNSWNYRQGEYY
ncbi:L-threonylcarbamoyladenylate synthase [Streptococcus sobrinus]|uniref:Translation factor (SUA5) n=1 Tax=Streptococcus sobrinus TaxID=1310 RepID=A0ABM6W5C9_9STRE|nr:Sua5/YciO/YrdC/YwlC family protein [Streptococcus sobrinus]AWN20943.1 translation factor (SUA5) [Streptococcus sobrinus]RKW11862.1 MAG: translation factor (SUA5) [Catonella sp.]SQG13726.1 putative translation factor (SUA5) [Streptococcus sobrinus]